MANSTQSLSSGEPGSSGRELFEGSTATGHGEKQSTFGTGYKEGTEAGDKGNHGEHDHDLGSGPHKRSGSGTHQSGGLTGAAAGLSGGNHGSSGLTGGNHGSSGLTGGNDHHNRGVTGGHSGSGTGDLSGRPADISSAVKVPHEEHALHGAGIQSIGGASIGGNHNPRSLNQEGLQGQSAEHRGHGREGAAGAAGLATGAGVGHSTSGHGSATQGVGQAAHGASHGHSAESGRHGLTNQFDHSDDKLLSGARHEADLPTHGQINKDSLNPANLLNRGADKADQKANENDVKGGSTTQDKAERAANQRNL